MPSYMLVCLCTLAMCSLLGVLFLTQSPEESSSQPASNPLEILDREASAYEHFLSDLVHRYNGERGRIYISNEGANLTGEALLERHRTAIAQGSRRNSERCEGDPTIAIGKPTVITVATVDGDRTFVVYVPASYIAKHTQGDGTFTPAPVIMLVHGLNDNCERFMQNTGFMEHADEDGSIVVSLCGTMGWLGVAFNAGMCCGFTGEKPDELAFIMQVLGVLGYASAGVGPADDQHLQLCVNEEKVLTVGFSNGAFLAEVLACRAPALFRAVASVGGVTEPRPGGAEGLVKCTADIQQNNPAHHRPSVLMIHGDADGMVPWGGSYFLGFPSMPDNIDGWTARNGCDIAKATSTINNSFFVNTIYPGCAVEGERGMGVASGAPANVEIVRVIGGAHLWPERDGFSTTQHIYDFGEAAFHGWD